MKILIINGPNLNLLGTRQPEIYGSKTFESVLSDLREEFSQHELLYFQSNHEGDLIDFIQKEGPLSGGMVINAGGLTHTSVSLADTIANLSVPVIELHISNVFARESFRHHSYLSAVCKGVVCGLGLKGYSLAISYLTTPN